MHGSLRRFPSCLHEAIEIRVPEVTVPFDHLTSDQDGVHVARVRLSDGGGW
jgi:hypothetical protein